MTKDLQTARQETAQFLAEFEAEDAALEKRLRAEFPEAYEAAEQAFRALAGGTDDETPADEDWDEAED